MSRTFSFPTSHQSTDVALHRYKSEIETAIVEVDRLNDARGVQMNRVKLVEREKSALEASPIRYRFRSAVTDL